ncbi:MAG: hypothetical protein Q4A37_00095 [Candidatus Saccharibacteria bacterium]|nr:hypothetical protein [Candidatus Saccharibacteria bacterium]
MAKRCYARMITRQSALVARRLAAGMYIVLLLLQLFAFERVVATPGVAMLWMIVLVLAELGALPFLLGMQGLSRTVRMASALCGPLAIGLLFGAESLALAHRQTVVAGAVLDLPAGVWSLWFIAGLAALVVWGLAPSCSERLVYCSRLQKRKGKRKIK